MKTSFFLAIAFSLLENLSSGEGNSPCKELTNNRFPLIENIPAIPVHVLGMDCCVGVVPFRDDAVLDSSFCKLLKMIGGDDVDLTSGPFKTSSSVYSSPTFLLTNGVKFQDTSAICVDLSHARRIADVPFYGTLGMNFLKSKTLFFDFDSKEFSFPEEVSPITFEFKEPLGSHDGIPFLLLDVAEGGFDSFRIDTSANFSLVLSKDLFQRLVEEGKLIIISSTLIKSDSVLWRVGVLSSITLGPHKFTNVRVIEGGKTNSIGLSLLKRFSVVFDFPKHTAFFRRGKHFSSPEPFNLAGFTAGRESGNTFIVCVNQGSPCEKNGLLEGDKLLQINSKPANTFSHEQIHELCSTPNTDLTLTLLRDSKEWNVTLKLIRDPDPFPNKSK